MVYFVVDYTDEESRNNWGTFKQTENVTDPSSGLYYRVEFLGTLYEYAVQQRKCCTRCRKPLMKRPRKESEEDDTLILGPFLRNQKNTAKSQLTSAGIECSQLDRTDDKFEGATVLCTGCLRIVESLSREQQSPEEEVVSYYEQVVPFNCPVNGFPFESRVPRMYGSASPDETFTYSPWTSGVTQVEPGTSGNFEAAHALPGNDFFFRLEPGVERIPSVAPIMCGTPNMSLQLGMPLISQEDYQAIQQEVGAEYVLNAEGAEESRSHHEVNETNREVEHAPLEQIMSEEEEQKVKTEEPLLFHLVRKRKAQKENTVPAPAPIPTVNTSNKEPKHLNRPQSSSRVNKNNNVAVERIPSRVQSVLEEKHEVNQEPSIATVALVVNPKAQDITKPGPSSQINANLLDLTNVNPTEETLETFDELWASKRATLAKQLQKARENPVQLPAELKAEEEEELSKKQELECHLRNKLRKHLSGMPNCLALIEEPTVTKTTKVIDCITLSSDDEDEVPTGNVGTTKDKETVKEETEQPADKSQNTGEGNPEISIVEASISEDVRVEQVSSEDNMIEVYECPAMNPSTSNEDVAVEQIISEVSPHEIESPASPDPATQVEPEYVLMDSEVVEEQQEVVEIETEPNVVDTETEASKLQIVIEDEKFHDAEEPCSSGMDSTISSSSLTINYDTDGSSVVEMSPVPKGDLIPIRYYTPEEITETQVHNEVHNEDARIGGAHLSGASVNTTSFDTDPVNGNDKLESVLEEAISEEQEMDLLGPPEEYFDAEASPSTSPNLSKQLDVSADSGYLEESFIENADPQQVEDETVEKASRNERKRSLVVDMLPITVDTSAAKLRSKYGRDWSHLRKSYTVEALSEMLKKGWAGIRPEYLAIRAKIRKLADAPARELRFAFPEFVSDRPELLDLSKLKESDWNTGRNERQQDLFSKRRVVEAHRNYESRLAAGGVHQVPLKLKRKRQVEKIARIKNDKLRGAESPPAKRVCFYLNESSDPEVSSVSNEKPTILCLSTFVAEVLKSKKRCPEEAEHVYGTSANDDDTINKEIEHEDSFQVEEPVELTMDEELSSETVTASELNEDSLEIVIVPETSVETEDFIFEEIEYEASVPIEDILEEYIIDKEASPDESATSEINIKETVPETSATHQKKNMTIDMEPEAQVQSEDVTEAKPTVTGEEESEHTRISKQPLHPVMDSESDDDDVVWLGSYRKESEVIEQEEMVVDNSPQPGIDENPESLIVSDSPQLYMEVVVEESILDYGGSITPASWSGTEYPTSSGSTSVLAEETLINKGTTVDEREVSRKNRRQVKSPKKLEGFGDADRAQSSSRQSTFRNLENECSSRTSSDLSAESVDAEDCPILSRSHGVVIMDEAGSAPSSSRQSTSRNQESRCSSISSSDSSVESVDAEVSRSNISPQDKITILLEEYKRKMVEKRTRLRSVYFNDYCRLCQHPLPNVKNPPILKYLALQHAKQHLLEANTPPFRCLVCQEGFLEPTDCQNHLHHVHDNAPQNMAKDLSQDRRYNELLATMMGECFDVYAPDTPT